MTDVVLYHHVQGLTPGFVALADALRAGGHTVHTPDLFDGRTFDSIDEGIAHVRSIGEEVLRDKGIAAAEGLPDDLVAGGTSFGAMVAMALVAQRPGARGMLSYESFVDPKWVGGWDRDVPVQVHGSQDDEFFTEDLESAQEYAGRHEGVEIFLYPGLGHLFTDASTAAADPEATAQVVARSLDFLERVG